MNRTFSRSAAFSLVEVTLALGIMAFCMVAIFGLLPVGFNSNQAAIEQTAAAALASALVADLRQTPLPTSGATVDPQSPRFLISVPPKLGSTSTHTLFLTEDGTVADANASTSPPISAQDKPADPAQNPRYRATVVFSLPVRDTDRSATGVRVLITWPAAANPSGGDLPSKFSGSFETLIALDNR